MIFKTLRVDRKIRFAAGNSPSHRYQDKSVSCLDGR